MSYHAMGDISSDNFNSTKYPGICKPSNTSTLSTFKSLQTQLSRIAQAKGQATIAIDGDIGPATLSLFGKYQAELVAYAGSQLDVGSGAIVGSVSATSCSSVAAQADTIADIARQYADSLGAPSTPKTPAPAKPPTLVSKTGLETAAPTGMTAGLLDAWTNLGGTGQMIALAAVGGVAYVMLTSKRRRGRR